MDAKGRPTHVVFRAVDDVTGEGLPGATATLREEDFEPVTGLVPAVRTGVADAHGWIRIRADDLGWEPSWLGAVKAYVEAPGHAGLAYTKGTGGEARLARARDVVVEVRDAFDRPVPGATIGVHDAGLCGHMPDQRAAVMGIPLDEVRVDLRGEIDFRGMFGLDAKVPIRFSRIEYATTLVSRADDATLRKLAETVEAHCPLLDTFQRPTEVRSSLTLNGRRVS